MDCDVHSCTEKIEQCIYCNCDQCRAIAIYDFICALLNAIKMTIRAWIGKVNGIGRSKKEIGRK